MNRKNTQSFAILVAVFATLCSVCLPAQAQENRFTVPITDPSRPVTLRAHLLNGSITVKAGAVKDVIVEARTRGESNRDESARTENGMKRIPMTSTGLNIEAENNQVRISTDSFQRTVDLTLTVPVKTSLSLKTVNDGNIVVNGVDGEMDIDDVNGSVTLNHVSGSVVAHALNGKVLASLSRVDPKPMAFSSMNGDIDVTLPADTKATLNMRTDNGEVYSDFDVQLQTTAPQQTIEDNRNEGGKYRVKIDKNVRGTINGGGPEIQLKDFNGNIYIRKGGPNSR
jgi:DUF4097 and DUF4098 domain-containing protein YvlB